LFFLKQMLWLKGENLKGAYTLLFANLTKAAIAVEVAITLRSASFNNFLWVRVIIIKNFL